MFSEIQSGQWNPPDALNAVEPGVEGGDLWYAVVQHHGGVNGVATGDPLVCAEKITSEVCVGQGYVQHHGTDGGKQVVNVTRKITPAER